jgi:hypothetical protein
LDGKTRSSVPSAPADAASSGALLEGSSDAITRVPRSPVIGAILWVGLLAGSLDGLDAMVSCWLRGITTLRLFQYIASGLLGVAAFQGGLATGVLGCLLHFLIAMGATTIYYLLTLRLPILLRRPAICGPLYGIGVYVVMHYLVVPLSAAPPQPQPTLNWVLNQLFSHTLLVGLPIALALSRLTQAGAGNA